MPMSQRPMVTTRTGTVFGIAHDLADQLGHDTVTDVHVLIGLLREAKNIGAQLLVYARGLNPSELESALLAEIPSTGPAVEGEASTAWEKRAWTPTDERILAAAAQEAADLGSEATGCEHVLLSLVRDETTTSAKVLGARGVYHADLLTELKKMRSRQ